MFSYVLIGLWGQLSAEAVMPIKVFFLISKEIRLIVLHWGAVGWNQLLAASKSQSLTFLEFCKPVVKIQPLLKIKLYKVTIKYIMLKTKVDFQFATYYSISWHLTTIYGDRLSISWGYFCLLGLQSRNIIQWQNVCDSLSSSGWWHADSSELPTMGVFTPWKMADVTDQGFYFL